MTWEYSIMDSAKEIPEKSHLDADSAAKIIANDIFDDRLTSLKGDTETALHDVPGLKPMQLVGNVNDRLHDLGANRILEDAGDHPGPGSGEHWSRLAVAQFNHDRGGPQQIYQYDVKWND